MLELEKHPGFATELPGRFFRNEEVFLDGYFNVQVFIVGTVDRAHSAAAELLDDAVTFVQLPIRFQSHLIVREVLTSSAWLLRISPELKCWRDLYWYLIGENPAQSAKFQPRFSRSFRSILPLSVPPKVG